MLPRHSLPLLIALVTVAAACSSGDDATAPSSSQAATTSTTSVATTLPATTTTPPAATTTEAPTTSTLTTTQPATTVVTTTLPDLGLTEAQLADREVARTALITLDVFPDGWVEIPDDGDEDDPATEAFQDEFDACLGRHDEDRVGDDLDPLSISSGDFEPSDDDTTTISHKVVLAPDEATAITAMSEYLFNGAEGCLAGVVESFYVTSFAANPDLSGVEVGDVVVIQQTFADAADIAIGIVVEVPLTVDGQSASQFLEFLYQRQGRALSQLGFSTFGARFDRTGYTVLGDEAAHRLAAIDS